VRAVILAGGKGTRLAPYTTVLPKPLLPVGDRPILEIIIRQLEAARFERVTLATGYLGSLIENYVDNYLGRSPETNCTLDFVRENEPLGTAGALATIPDLDDSFLTMNGDVLTTPVYRRLFRAHVESGATATIATKAWTQQLDFGILHLDGEMGPTHRVKRIEEKPSVSWPVSMGVYVFEPRVLDYIEPGKRLDFPELVTRLIENGEPVASYLHTGYWADIGQIADFEAAVQHYEESAAEFVHDMDTDPLPSRRRITRDQDVSIPTANGNR
jgi:NDP-mannose synthase